MSEFDPDRWLRAVDAYSRGLTLRFERARFEERLVSGRKLPRALMRPVIGRRGDEVRRWDLMLAAAVELGVCTSAVSSAVRAGHKIDGWSFERA